MITLDQAQQIAALYQSPGTDGWRFAAFASTGGYNPGLIADLMREINHEHDQSHVEELYRLLFFVIDNYAEGEDDDRVV